MPGRLILLLLGACNGDEASPDAALLDATFDAAPLDARADALVFDAPPGVPDAVPGPDASPVPSGQRLVPGGPFLRGCAGLGCGFDESPARTITVSAFLIDEREVAQVELAACVSAGACVAPVDHYDPTSSLPVRNVSFAGAAAYCAFRGGRLPREAEWEKAMRGTDGRTYPWGEAAPTCDAAVGAGCGGPLDTGGRPAGASPYGVVDGAGNVREWTADFYAADYYADAPDTDPGGPAEGATRAVRGGSYVSSPAQLRVTARSAADPALNHDDIGFRCVHDVEPLGR